MGRDMNTYLDFAEDDYQFFADAYDLGKRYPGDSSFHPTEQEVDEAMDAVRQTREYVYSVIKSFDGNGVCEPQKKEL